MSEKNKRNARVQARYDALRAEQKHGHYETMFKVVSEEVEPLSTEIERLRALLEEGRRDLTDRGRLDWKVSADDYFAALTTSQRGTE